MKSGDIVNFKDATEDEAGIDYKVIWIDYPRVMIEAQLGWSINPTYIVNVNDIEKA